MFYIYRITNLINGKTYVGQHEYKKLNEYYMGSGVHLVRAQKKYGMENFKKEILVFNISTQEHANLLEETFIAAEREKVGRENCYNISDGGQGNHTKGIHFSEEHKRHLSEAHKNKHFSEETKKKMSESHKNKPHSEEWNRKVAEANKGKPSGMKGKHHSEETKKKMREAMKGRPRSWGKHWKLVDGKRVWY